MLIEYRSNNSGGSWWLKDDDWHALEAAGWQVEWARDRKESWFTPDAKGRWLGALATRASKEFDSPYAAIREFERITGQDASDEGCNCCGPPHSFSWTDGEGDSQYLYGSECLSVLYENPPSTLREAARRLSGETQ